MNPYPAPEGFVARNLSTGSAWFRPKMERPILLAWEKAGARLRLSNVARRLPESRKHTGRVPVYSAPFPGAGVLVVRPCTHGGWWGRLAQDLYLGPNRALQEIRASVRLGQMKIPTPSVEAVIFYPAGPFVRIEVVTRHIPDSRDLVQGLASRPASGARKRLFAAVRKLLTQLHHHGIRHPDLNARNILLTSSGACTAWLLDIDTVRFGEPHADPVDAANRNRLLRSLLKRARLGDLGWSEPEVAKLWRELFPRR